MYKNQKAAVSQEWTGIRQDALRDTENNCRYFTGRKTRLATNQEIGDGYILQGWLQIDFLAIDNFTRVGFESNGRGWIDLTRDVYKSDGRDG
ncbi:hypothetical protein ACX0G7_18135 [Flavitalea antarctica]